MARLFISTIVLLITTVKLFVILLDAENLLREMGDISYAESTPRYRFSANIGVAVRMNEIVNTITADSQYSRITWSRDELYRLRRISTTPSSAVLSALSTAGLLRYRGCRAGARRRRNIVVISGHRPDRLSPPSKNTCRQRQLLHIPTVGTLKSTVSASLPSAPSVYVFNSASLAKPHALELLTTELMSYKTDVAIISESHLKAKHSDSAFNIDGYSMYRRDRNGRRGGGVAVYTRSSLDTQEWVYEKNDLRFELLWVRIRMSVDRDFFMGALYHPPKALYNDNELIDYIESSMQVILETYTSSIIIIAGDLNKLDDNQITLRTGLLSLVHQPTRGENCLDRLYTSEPVYDGVSVVKSAAKSDHLAIVACSDKTMMLSNKTVRKASYRQHKPSQHAAMLSYAAQADFHVPTELGVQAASDWFYERCQLLMDKFYPLREISVTTKDPSFVTPEVKMMLRRRNRLMRRGRIEEAEAITLRVSKVVIAHTSKSLHSENGVTDTKTMWEEVRKLTGKSCSSDVRNSLTAHDLNNHFASISEDKLFVSSVKKETVSACECVHFTTEWDMFNLLDKQKKTAAGSDLLPAWFLKIGAPFLAAPITALFNLSISTSIVPSQWKNACIVPLAKVVHPITAIDYRPLSITSILSRHIERIVVRKHLYPLYCVSAQPFIPHEISFRDQFAFRPTGSTVAAVISLLDSVTSMLTTNDYVRIIALDLSKAFDCVRQSTILQKIAQLPIADNIHNWLVDYYDQRTHCTKYQGVTSQNCPLFASVVQGSALGPSAFIIAASDLHPVTKGNDMKKYADDMYLLIPSSNDSTCQAEIDNVVRWADTNNLKLNHSKSEEIIIYANKSSLRKLGTSVPNLQGIKRVRTIKMLGVLISDDLKAKPHVDSIITSCSQMLFALRTLKSHGLANSALHLVYSSTILAKLLYCASAWWGYASAEDTNRVERFVARSIKLGYCDEGTDITGLIKHADMKLFDKICNNEDHVLHFLLPPPADYMYNLRERPHSRQLPSLTQNKVSFLHKNFISRMLLYDSY
jgi:hypothetical protein